MDIIEFHCKLLISWSVPLIMEYIVVNLSDKQAILEYTWPLNDGSGIYTWGMM